MNSPSGVISRIGGMYVAFGVQNESQRFLDAETLGGLFLKLRELPQADGIRMTPGYGLAGTDHFRIYKEFLRARL